MREFEEVTAQSESHRRREVDKSAHPEALLGRAAAAGRIDAAGTNGLLKLQRQVGNSGTSAMLGEERSPVLDVVASPGEALDQDVRADMEASLGHDFSDVRVHRDEAAHASAEAVQAKAYTVGSHVVFQRDAFAPGSDAGRHVLAHELSHVVQQRSGPVEGTAAPGGIRVSDPSDRFEREAATIADLALAAGPAPSPGAASIPGVQRQPEEDEVEASSSGPSSGTSSVQRQPEEDEVEATSSGPSSG